MRLNTLFTILMVVLLACICSCQQLTRFEIENVYTKTDPDRIVKEAFSRHSIRLTLGDSVEIQKFCPEKPLGINVVGVYWSNDGGPDEVYVSVDGQFVGIFWSEFTYGGLIRKVLESF